MSVVGRWRIVETELWDSDALNLVAPAFIDFGEDGLGSFGFIAVQGELDCREVIRDGRPGVEFSWEGNDECDPANGRGWAVLEEDDSLRGRIFFHLGDDSSFTAVRRGEPTNRENSGGSAAPVERETPFYPGRFIGDARLSFVNGLERPLPRSGSRQPPRFTTTTTCAREFSPLPWPNVPPGYTSLGFPGPLRSP